MKIQTSSRCQADFRAAHIEASRQRCPTIECEFGFNKGQLCEQTHQLGDGGHIPTILKIHMSNPIRREVSLQEVPQTQRVAISARVCEIVVPFDNVRDIPAPFPPLVHGVDIVQGHHPAPRLIRLQVKDDSPVPCLVHKQVAHLIGVLRNTLRKEKCEGNE